MVVSHYPPLQPHNGKTLKVLGIARVSKPKDGKPKRRDSQGKHKELSLEDQEALMRNWLRDNYRKRFDLRVIGSTGSGEFLDREESVQATAAVESGEYDLVLTEDLGRVFRRVHAHLFCECCEDNNTRLIALNDYVDTGREDWRMAAFFAVMRHETYNRDTALRIRRSLRNRFTQGGIFQCPVYGYIKPKGAKHEDEVKKDPAAEAIYDEWFRRLEEGAWYSDVADWLNRLEIPVGPYCRGTKWIGRMVRRITLNPILKGLRVRNAKISRRINKSGRHKSFDAPVEERLERECPHLAFIRPDRYDRLIRKLRPRANEKYRRGRKKDLDGHRRITKKWRAWPGHHLQCGVCGNPFYWGGHGQAEHMMCAGCRDYECWNATTFDGIKAAQNLCEAILAEIEALEGFGVTFLQKVRAKAKSQLSASDSQLKKLARELETVRRKLERVKGMILEEAKGSRTLAQTLLELEAEEDRLVQQREVLLRRCQQQNLDIPSMDEIKQEAREVMGALPQSPEFCARMRDLLPSLKVFPYRLVDGGAIVLRAKGILNLTTLVPERFQLDEVSNLLQREFTVDLFDQPQRERFREQVVNLRRAGVPERKIAAELGITVTAAQRAMALQRLMDEQGLTDPYVLVTEPPADCTKLRRHLHSRYRFQPLPGHPDW